MSTSYVLFVNSGYKYNISQGKRNSYTVVIWGQNCSFMSNIANNYMKIDPKRAQKQSTYVVKNFLDVKITKPLLS